MELQRSDLRGYLLGLIAMGALMTILFLGSCSSNTEPTAAPPADIEDDDVSGEIHIVDRTGKRWEVSHAKDQYGMMPELFQFGLGPDAIRPINDPELIAAGDDAFPSADGQFFVLGTEIGGEARAYRITTMSRVEVANEQFGDAHVAVAY